MIERIEGLPEGIAGCRAEGKVTREDYEQVVLPAIEEARLSRDRIGFLYHLGPGFSGFTAGALLDDVRVGLRHLHAFGRIAVVSDVDWVRNSVRLLTFAMPCPVRTFDNAELEEARAWVADLGG